MKSKLEIDLSKKLRKVKNINVTYETTVLPYILRKNYVADFTCIKRKNGQTIVIEAKGWFRPEDRAKMLAVKESNPDVDIRFIFPRDNKLNKNSNTKYSDWCIKNGFPFHIGLNIPREWFT